MKSNETNPESIFNELANKQEDLNEYLIKAEAMGQVAITTTFLELSEDVIYNYLWALSDIISKAKIINEGLVDILIKQKKINL